jgi:DNA-binding MarR family transcriptional regulator
MAEPKSLPGRSANSQDSVDLIQHAWERERPGTPAGSIGVITRIWRISKLLTDERRRTLAHLGIDAATLDLLSTLRRAGPPYRLTAGALAGQSLVSAGAISQRVARAERAGLVRRGRSDADGRLSYVTLTEAGHALVERSVDGLLRHEETLLSALTGEQRGQLAEQLKVLLASLTPDPGPLYNERLGYPPRYPACPGWGTCWVLSAPPYPRVPGRGNVLGSFYPSLPSVPRLWQRARYERGVAEPGLRRAAGRNRGTHRAVRTRLGG